MADSVVSIDRVSPASSAAISSSMREREGREQLLVCAVIEPGRHHGPVVAGVAAQLAPVRRGGKHPVDSEPVWIEVNGRELGVELGSPPLERIGASGQAVGPRVQERDAEARATLAIGGKTAPLPEQLVAAMGERVADHPHRGREPRAQIVLVRDQRPSQSRPSRCSCSTSWRAIDGKIGCPADGRRPGTPADAQPCCARACPVRSCSTRTRISASTTRTATAAAPRS